MSQLSNEIKSDFPIFEGSDLVYLDNAATTQKPQSVLDSINSSYTESNANVHRALYSLGAKATEKYEGARKKISAFIGANSSKEIIFTSGATESLNLLAYSLGNDINPGDEILISEMEHHSNIIPWQQLAKRTGSIIRYIPITDDGELDLSQSDRLFNVKTKIVSITHISNVLGTINPIKKISSLTNQCGAVLIIDGAQGAAHKKIDVKNKNQVVIHSCKGDFQYSRRDVQCKVDISRRRKARNNHTATHLMHRALKNVLGEHVNQAGSLVHPDYLLFDLTHFGKITQSQIEKLATVHNIFCTKTKIWK